MQQAIPEINLLEKEARQSFDTFIRLLSSVSDDKFNAVPFEGSWTAAQVGDHTHKFLKGVAAARSRPAEKPARNYDDLVDTIRQAFLNFEVKYKSPSFVEPDKNGIDKNLLIENLSGVTKEIIDLIRKEDLSLLSKGAELPTIGELTRLEWVYFGIYHTQRHTYQLENIILHLS